MTGKSQVNSQGVLLCRLPSRSTPRRPRTVGDSGLTYPPTTATLITGEHDAVLVDTQFLEGEFGREIAADLAALVTRADTDDGVGAVVLTGTHPTRFLAHAEISWLKEMGARSATRSTTSPSTTPCSA